MGEKGVMNLYGYNTSIWRVGKRNIGRFHYDVCYGTTIVNTHAFHEVSARRRKRRKIAATNHVDMI